MNASSEQAVVTLRRFERGVAQLIVDVPGEPVNTLRPQFAAQLEAALAEIEQDSTILAALLVSGKPGHFIAGADINMLAEVPGAEQATALSQRGQQAVRALEECRVPVVAVIDGACLGGGLELALGCQGRVASDSPATQLGVPESQLGILPGMGATQRLPRLLGLAAALDLLLSGRQLSASRALSLGLVDEVVRPAHLLKAATERALSLAQQQLAPSSAFGSLREMLRPGELRDLAISENPIGRKVVFDNAEKQLKKKSGHNYPAFAAILEVVRLGLEQGSAAGYEAEAASFGQLVTSEVSAALRHLYMSGQSLKKESEGREVDEKIERVGVIGAGLMGAGVSYVSLLNAGAHVRLNDVSLESLGRGLQSIAGQLDKRVERGRLSRRHRDRLLAQVTRTTSMAGFSSLDLVIEAVFEDLELKRKILADFEAVASPEAIFATNTSSLQLGLIASGARHPARVIGMHYFSPVARMPLLEIVTTEKTDPQVVKRCVQFGLAQKKTVIVVGDGPGFYTTRILGAYLNEAAYALNEGARIESVDQELVDAGFPVGPFTLLDEIGLDVGDKVARVLQQGLGDRLAPPAHLGRLIEAGRKGKKNKRGFYDYSSTSGKQRPVDRSVYGDMSMEEPARAAPSGGLSEADSVAERCLLKMVNEAVYCLGEEVLMNPRDGDIGAVYGLGFPPYLGGPFHFVDSRSPKEVVLRLRRLESRYGQRFTPAPRLVQLAESGGKFFR